MARLRQSYSAHTIFLIATNFIIGSPRGGTDKESHRHGKTREAFLARASDLEAHEALGFGARVLTTQQPYLPHFGLIVVTCERGDMRLSPNGILIHGTQSTREIAVPRGAGRP